MRIKKIDRWICIYIYISILFFLWGWCKPWIAAITTAAVVYCFLIFDKESDKTNNDIFLDKRSLAFTIFFLLLIAYYVGWGRFTPQAYDWDKHNAVLSDLVNREWPVYYHNGSDSSMLVYYIAQYLVPAIIGKVCHSFRAAEIALFVWSGVGLILVDFCILWVFQIHDKWIQTLTPILLCFFSPPLAIAHMIQGIVFDGGSNLGNIHWYLCGPDIKLQYSSNFVLLRWCFPQVLVIWMSVLLLMKKQKNVQNYAFMFLPSILYGILSFLGFVPIVLSALIGECIAEGNKKVFFRRLFSLSNMLVAATLGVILLGYYYGNVFQKKPDDIGFRYLNYGGNMWCQYIIFIISMVGIYAICLWRDNKRNIMFIIATIELLMIPLFSMGLYNDFVMRCSIPGLFVFCCYVISFINRKIKCRNSFKNTTAMVVLTELLIIGAIYPVKECFAVIEEDKVFQLESNVTSTTLEKYANRNDETIQDDLRYNYYAYNIDENLFVRYMARSKEKE